MFDINNLAEIIQKLWTVLVLTFSLYLYFSTNRNYKKIENIINEYDFKLKTLAPMGFYLYYQYEKKFQPKGLYKQTKKISELFGIQKADLFIKVHYSQKITMGIGGLIGISLINFVGNGEPSLQLIAVILPVLLFYWPDKELDIKIEQKKNDILMDLPEFLNSLILLMNAGLPLNTAVEKSVMERMQNRPLYRELHQLMTEIKAGRPIIQAYENFAQRCRVPEITRLVSAIAQNLNKGTDDFIIILKDFSSEAWLKRKELARKHGEEAAAKLVFPMIMVFFAITLIVLAPAFFSMKL